MNRSNTMHTAPDQKIDGTPSARTWFASGERVGLINAIGQNEVQAIMSNTFRPYRQQVAVRQQLI